MKTTIIISSCIFLVLGSCKHSNPQNKEKEAIPAALENGGSSFDIISKRGSGDMVTSLYDELAEKDADLKKLETDIQHVEEGKNDSLALFHQYDEKIKAYFNSAKGHVGQIKDSVLRDKMSVLIANSLTKYNTSIARHNDFINSIDTKSITLEDLHSALKIIKSLPMINKY